MKGRVIKGIAGFYYVQTKTGLYECKAKGIFRKQKIKIIPGDYVTIEVLNEEEKKGNIETLADRKNELIRPVVSNVEQALIIFAASQPEPNFNLLDRLILLMEEQEVEISICFNKADLVTEQEKERLREIYRNCGCEVFFTSTKEKQGIGELKEKLFGKTTVLAGPSGVGKSSTINLLQNHVMMETGAVSEKIARGKHTTRHAELIEIEEGTYIVDTPGFSSLYTLDIEKEQLKEYYEEFRECNGGCRFLGCLHYKEPDCLVKEKVEFGEISKLRYENYIQILEEIKEKKKY
ncbi:MAG: ribosome small subunit-dependent GTPase A [Lachnospiraceae bacterium]|nr:ribosome small subunit-dependent GTPase A [Lachnospiraceae bacterium]